MINLKEQVQNNSEVASLLRSNIPFVSRNIQENMWQSVKNWAADRGDRLARAAKEVGNRAASNVLGTVQRGMENEAQYQSRVGAKYELLKTSEKLGMEPAALQNIRQAHSRFGGMSPRHPGPGASDADISKYHADKKDWETGEKVRRLSSAARAADPNYARTLKSSERMDRNNQRVLRGQPVNFTNPGSPAPQLRGLGGLFNRIKQGVKTSTGSADALRNQRQSNVESERNARRQITAIHGRDPDNWIERLRVGLNRRRI